MGVGGDIGRPKEQGGRVVVEEGNRERAGLGLAGEFGDGALAGEGDGGDLGLGGGEGDGGASAAVLKRDVADLEGDSVGAHRVVEGHRHGIRGALDGRRAGEGEPGEVRVRAVDRAVAGPAQILERAAGGRVGVDADRGLRVDAADLVDAGMFVGRREDRVGDHHVGLAALVGRLHRRIGERLVLVQVEREPQRRVRSGHRGDGVRPSPVRDGPVVGEVRHGARDEVRGGGGDGGGEEACEDGRRAGETSPSAMEGFGLHVRFFLKGGSRSRRGSGTAGIIPSHACACQAPLRRESEGASPFPASSRRGPPGPCSGHPKSASARGMGLPGDMTRSPAPPGSARRR